MDGAAPHVYGIETANLVVLTTGAHGILFESFSKLSIAELPSSFTSKSIEEGPEQVALHVIHPVVLFVSCLLWLKSDWAGRVAYLLPANPYVKARNKYLWK